MNSEEIRSLYGAGLKKLIFENENSINALAHIAAEYQSYAAEVVSIIEEYIAKVDAKIKLCLLNLINCILQKVGGVYVALFSDNISIVFCKIFKVVDSDSRIKMYNLRKVWTDIFPAEKLYEIDFKANLLDATWPMTPQNPYLVDVNSKYLPQNSLLRIQDELLEKEKALLEVQEKKLQIEVLKVQIKLGRQITYTSRQTNEQSASGNEHSGQCENRDPGSEKPQENTSSSPCQMKDNEYIHVTDDEDSNDGNLGNVQQFDKNRLNLNQRHTATPDFTLDTDGMNRNDYHIKPPNYAKRYEPAGRVRFGGNKNDPHWKGHDDRWSATAQYDQDFISFETEDLDSNATEQSESHWSYSLSHWNSFRQRKHFGRGGNNRFQFANYRDWKNNQWRNGRGRFAAGRFQRKLRNAGRHPYNHAWKERCNDFDRRPTLKSEMLKLCKYDRILRDDCDVDLRNKLPDSNKKPNRSTNLSIGKSQSSASPKKSISKPPAQNSAGTPSDRKNPENDLDACAIDIERELARIEEAFCLLDGRPDSPAKKLCETNNNASEEEDDSEFSEIYDVAASNESSEMDETEDRFSRDKLEDFPASSREADPIGLTSSIDGNNKCKPFTSIRKKVQINLKRLDKSNKAVPFTRKN